jgi:MFS family permease
MFSEGRTQWNTNPLRAQSYGVYLSYYLSNQTYPEARSINFAFIGGLNLAVAMLVAPVVTALVRQYEIHLPMSLGILMFGIAYITASFSNRIWQLYISQGALVGLGVGFIYIPSIAILSQWFSSKRSLANGISAVGSGIGGIIFSLSTGAMIKNVGLAWSLRLIGILAVTANTLATIFIRGRNRIIQPASIPFDLGLLRRYDVFLLLGWVFINMFGYIVLLFSLSDYAISIISVLAHDSPSVRV